MLNTYLLQTTNTSFTPLYRISLTDTGVSILDIKQLSMYIVESITGDTVINHAFPEPELGSILVNISHLTDQERERHASWHGTDFSDDFALFTVPKSEVTLSYSLPRGIYFAYIVNTSDGQLR